MELTTPLLGAHGHIALLAMACAKINALVDNSPEMKTISASPIAATTTNLTYGVILSAKHARQHPLIALVATMPTTLLTCASFHSVAPM